MNITTSTLISTFTALLIWTLALQTRFEVYFEPIQYSNKNVVKAKPVDTIEVDPYIQGLDTLNQFELLLKMYDLSQSIWFNTHNAKDQIEYYQKRLANAKNRDARIIEQSHIDFYTRCIKVTAPQTIEYLKEVYRYLDSTNKARCREELRRLKLNPSLIDSNYTN